MCILVFLAVMSEVTYVAGEILIILSACRPIDMHEVCMSS